MNEAYDHILNRHSCRAYESIAVEHDKLEDIIKAGLHAPTAMNRQETHFTVVSGENLTRLINAVVEAILSGELYYSREIDASFRPHYDAPYLILVSAPTENPFSCQDCSCALENIFLAASALGLGSCWINIFLHACKTPSVRSIMTELGVPCGNTVYAGAAIGYPSDPLRIVEHDPNGRVVWS